MDSQQGFSPSDMLEKIRKIEYASNEGEYSLRMGLMLTIVAAIYAFILLVRGKPLDDFIWMGAVILFGMAAYCFHGVTQHRSNLMQRSDELDLQIRQTDVMYMDLQEYVAELQAENDTLRGRWLRNRKDARNLKSQLRNSHRRNWILGGICAFTTLIISMLAWRLTRR